jgi:carbamoyl-phosphate synthase large subunit
MNILVTGAGSLIGHGVLRSLRLMHARDIVIHTADPDPCAAGHWLGDFGVTIPPAKDPGYIEALRKVIDDHKIDVVFIGTDPELLKISKATSTLGARVVVSSPEVIGIGDDKWETVQFLKNNHFPFPDSALAEDAHSTQELIRRVGFPLIAKPRIGARSVGVMKLMNERDLSKLQGQSGYVIQELLPDEPGEFTAGTMTFDKTCYSCVIFKRDLKEGNTYRAYDVENVKHQEFLEKVSQRLPGVFGPINFQYRLRNDEPVIFEINSRFSGTTPLRTAIGVNEIEMALEYIATGATTRRSPTVKQVAIFRTWSDIIIPIAQVDEFKAKKSLANPSAKYFPFMDK